MSGKKEVHPGFEPGLLEDEIGIKIQCDNHYTNEPVEHCGCCEFLTPTQDPSSIEHGNDKPLVGPSFL